MTWMWDAPSGTYKDHALSSQIRQGAAAQAQFYPLLRPEPGYGKMRGQSITISRISQIAALAQRVSEVDRLPSARPAITPKTVTVSEWGLKIELTEFEEDLTHFQLRPQFRRMLTDNMRLTMDKMAADALKTTPIRFHTTGALTGTFSTGGVFGGTSSNNLDIGHIRLIKDYLSGTLKSPPFRNGKYMGILSTRAARGVKNDATYQAWLSATTREPFITGQMADVEGIVLVESNHIASDASRALDNDVGTGGVLGEAIFFGADAGFLAVVNEPEIRIGLSEDLGRFREMGWVGNLEAGLTWDTASEARVVYVGSL